MASHDELPQGAGNEGEPARSPRPPAGVAPLAAVTLLFVACNPNSKGDRPLATREWLTPMAYDSLRAVSVLFGRFQGTDTFDDETWTFDGVTGTWAQQATALQPPPCEGHAAVYDSVRGIVVLHAGFEGFETWSGETWEWDGSAWTLKSSPPAGPGFRSGHAMSFDPVRRRALLFGGRALTALTQDTWEWDGTRWISRNPSTSPGHRSRHAMVYDTLRQRTVLFGGFTNDNGADNETWEYNGVGVTPSWTLRVTAVQPSRRFLHALAYDSARGVVVLFGGHTGSAESDETWEWDGAAGTWTQRITTVQPPPLAGHSMTYDSARAVTVLYGGTPEETWEWDGVAGTWTQRIISVQALPFPEPAQAAIGSLARQAGCCSLRPRSDGSGLADPTEIPSRGRLVYLDQAGGAAQLTSVPLDGSAPPVRLNATLGPREAVESFELCPDGDLALFRIHGPAVHRLCCVAVDGSREPATLSAAAHNVLPDVRIAGARAVYRAGSEGTALYSVAVDGSQSSVRLSRPGRLEVVSDFEISADGSRAVYRARTGSRRALYHVLVDGSEAPAELDTDLDPDRVGDYRISPDSSRLVFLARADAHSRSELFSVPIDGSRAPVRLSEELDSAGGVADFRIDAAGTRVVYRSDRNGDGILELHSAPLDD